MVSDTDYQPQCFTESNLRDFLRTGWGAAGERVADHFFDLNDRYFAGKIKPVPIVITPTSPHGRWLGLTCGNARQNSASLIYLTRPSRGDSLVADRGVLLHEMIHASLMQRGDDPGHDGQPWRDEITRISRACNRTITAMPTKVKKVKMPDGSRKSKRIVQGGSLTQKEIATWPESIGLDFGDL